MRGGGNECFEREEEDYGFRIYSGVVMTEPYPFPPQVGLNLQTQLKGIISTHLGGVLT